MQNKQNLDSTASFFSKLKIPRLKCNPELITSPDVEIPTFSRKEQQPPSLFYMCQRRNSQTNISNPLLEILTRQKTNADKIMAPKVPPLKIQETYHSATKSQHSRGRSNIKILQNPFITDSRQSQKSTCTSQPKIPKPFLQRRAQLQMVNRVFSSISQHK